VARNVKCWQRLMERRCRPRWAERNHRVGESLVVRKRTWMFDCALARKVTISSLVVIPLRTLPLRNLDGIVIRTTMSLGELAFAAESRAWANEEREEPVEEDDEVQPRQELETEDSTPALGDGMATSE
jgi:hypothetical protein